MSQEYRPTTPPTSRRWGRFWPLLVPVVWCGLLQVVIGPGAIAPRESILPSLKRLLYDENDLTALALRGANLEAGRLPGRRDEPRWVRPAEFPAVLDEPGREYSERFYLEYPPAALAVFRLAFLVQFDRPPPLPPAVADSHQYPVGSHHPRNDTERAVWSRLGFAVRFHVVLMTAALVTLMLILARGYLPGGGLSGPIWLCALPGAAYFSLNRFDPLPALATAIAFGGLGRNRNILAGAALAVGAMLKLYPVLLVPVILRHLGVRRSGTFLLSFIGTGLFGLAVTWALTDWEATTGPIRVQLDRRLGTTQWTNYGRLLPTELAEWKNARLGMLALAVLAAVATRPPDLASVLRRCALVLIVFVNLSVFWSPQWVVWFLPLLVPLAGGRRWLIFALATLDIVMYFSFPVLFWLLWGGLSADGRIAAAEGMVYLRAAVWGWLAVGLLRDEWRAGRTTAAAFRRSLPELTEELRRAGEHAGRPRGLRWVAAEPSGDPLFVRDSASGQLLALLPVMVRFDPVPGSDLEEVPQAREPRPVTALFVADAAGWRTDGRIVFNLSPAQVVEKSGGRYLISGGAPDLG